MKIFHNFRIKILKFFDRIQHKKISDFLSNLLKGNLITLIDVGAADYIQPRWLKVSNYINYIGFEPDSRSFVELQNSFSKIKKNTFYDYGLWSFEGNMNLNLCRELFYQMLFALRVLR